MDITIPLLLTFMSPLKWKVVVKGWFGIALTTKRKEVPPRSDNPSEASHG